MNRLAIPALTATPAGIIILVATFVERARLADYIIPADQSAVNLWTIIGAALTGFGLLAGLLALLAEEIRATLLEAARVKK